MRHHVQTPLKSDFFPTPRALRGLHFEPSPWLTLRSSSFVVHPLLFLPRIMLPWEYSQEDVQETLEYYPGQEAQAVQTLDDFYHNSYKVAGLTV